MGRGLHVERDMLGNYLFGWSVSSGRGAPILEVQAAGLAPSILPSCWSPSYGHRWPARDRARTALVDRLLGSHAGQGLCRAPPGYGRRPCWPSGHARWAPGGLGFGRPPRQRSCGPVDLHRHRAGPGRVGRPGGVPAGHARRFVVATVVPQLVASVSAMTQPVALVLDQVGSTGGLGVPGRSPSLPSGCPRGRSLLVSQG